MLFSGPWRCLPFQKPPGSRERRACPDREEFAGLCRTKIRGNVRPVFLFLERAGACVTHEEVSAPRDNLEFVKYRTNIMRPLATAVLLLVAAAASVRGEVPALNASRRLQVWGAGKEEKLIGPHCTNIFIFN